jgi:DHA1 family tetracycline resistance protein-like MFS transporter
MLCCLVAFADSLGYAIVVPLLPFTTERFGASTLAVGLVFAAYSFCQLVAAPALGELSDRYGRRPILLGSLFGSGAGFGLLLVAESYGMLVLSRVVDGLTAGNVAILYAVVLDAVASDRWTRAFAYLGTATGLGILVGLLVSSALASFGLPLAAALGLTLALANLVLVARWLPETARRRPRARLRDAWGRLVGHVDATPLRRALSAVLLATVSQTAFLLALPLYLSQVLGYDERPATATIAGLFTLAAAFQGLALPRLVEWLGERRTSLAGFALVVAGAALIAAAASLLQVLAGGTLILWGVAALGPTLNALLGRTNTVLDQGALMGVSQSVTSAGQMLGPLVGYAALALISPLGYGAATGALALLGLLVALTIHGPEDRT